MKNHSQLTAELGVVAASALCWERLTGDDVDSLSVPQLLEVWQFVPVDSRFSVGQVIARAEQQGRGNFEEWSAVYHEAFHCQDKHEDLLEIAFRGMSRRLSTAEDWVKKLEHYGSYSCQQLGEFVEMALVRADGDLPILVRLYRLIRLSEEGEERRFTDRAINKIRACVALFND